MTDREALIEAMKCLQDLYAIVRKVADRVSRIETLIIPPQFPTFSEIASGYQREIEAKQLRLTDAEIAEIEREIESKHMEGE